MDFLYSSSEPAKAKADALILPVYSDFEKDPLVKAMDEALSGALSYRIKRAEYKGKKDSTLLVQGGEKSPYPSVLLYGMGERKAPESEGLWDFMHKAVNALRAPGARHLALALNLEAGLDAEFALAKLAQGALSGAYRFDRYKKEAAEQNKKSAPEKLSFFGMGAYTLKPDKAKAALARGKAVGEAVNFARNLVNEPAEAMTPAIFADTAKNAVKNLPNLTCKVEGPNEITKRKMGLFMAVARGSKNPPRLITLTYNPPKAKGKPIALVGKGLMFDSGGYSLKPSASMETMKCDMSGAAAVLATLIALAKLGIQKKVIGIVAACENMIGGGAYRVGDIYTAMNGKTIEVMNTDAEGRLTLADALVYAQTFKPELVVDLATLTGACVVALGEETVGVFCNGEGVSERIGSAFDRAGEDYWELPLNPRLKDLLKSPIADMQNVGGRFGGAITAALFLREFIPELPWSHFDIAGPAFHGKETGHLPKGGSGVGVTTLIELVDPTL